MNVNTADTQPVISEADAERNFLKTVLTPNAVPANPAATAALVQTPQAAAAPTVTPAVAPIIETSATPTAPVVAAAPVVETPATIPVITPEAPDPYASVLDTAFGAPAIPTTWDDPAKGVFKATFGADDPLAYKAEIEAKLEQANLLKTQYDQAAPVIEKLNGLPPALKQAFALIMANKYTEAQDYIRNTPDAILQNKEAKELSEQQLVDTYLPGKLTKEQWATLNDPEADTDVKDALRTRVDILKAAAADLHENQRTAIINSRQTEEQAQKQAFENYQAGVAASLANAKNSPLKGLVDPGTTEAIQTGKFLSDFVEQDGVTPTKDAVTRYLWSKHGPKLMEAAETRGYNRGKIEATLEATSRQPSTPSSARRNPGDTPVDQDPNTMWKQILLGQAGRT